MAGTLDTILSIGIPVGVIIFIFVALYAKMGEPLGRLISWIRSFFEDRKQNTEEIYEQILYG